MSQQQEVELNDLPEEVLVNVFELMNVETLLQSSLVCKKWNEIIGQNSAIMKKMKLVVDFHRKDFQLSPEDFTRNYQMIKIIGLEKDWRNLPTLMNRYSSLRVLEIVDCKTKETKKLNNLLARITKLENLSISMTSLMRCSLKLYVDVSHHNCLKSLTLISDYTTLKFPEAAQLTSLRISYLNDHKYSALIDFLVGQKSLEVLAIRSNSHRSLAKKARKDHNFERLLTVQFSPKKFVLNWDYNFFGSEKNFLLFMNKFANTLEELHFEQRYPESVYEMIFEKFRKLNTLRVNIGTAPDRNEFYQNLRENISIRELIIDGHGTDISIQGFIGKLPNIQTLVLENKYLEKDLTTFICNNLKMLKNLKVGGIDNEAFEGVYIPSLTTITVTLGYNTTQSWKQIVAAMPNIETLNVQLFYALNHSENVIRIITEGWTHLKHVMIGNEFDDLKAIFDIFLRNCKELKTVKISEDAFESCSEKENKAVLLDFERAGVQFTFYADKALEFTDSNDRPFKFE